MLKQATPVPSLGNIHIAARQRLTDRHLNLMEKIMKDNSHKKKYWILGTARCKRKNGKTTIQPCMNAYDSMPDVRKEAYLYEVDNVEGTKTLLWVMHPNNSLALPSINKKINVAGDSSAS